MKKHIGFDIDESEHETWKAYARAQERSLSSMIRLVVTRAVGEWKTEVAKQKLFVEHLEEL